MRLHLLGLFHTVPSPEFSHCAFTGRIIRFPKMMQPFGYEVIEYSNEGSATSADEHVVILSRDRLDELRKLMTPAPPYGEANLDTEVYREFTAKLNQELLARVKPGDIICHPFGHAHSYLGEMIPYAKHVEIGIGYPTCAFDFRVYETYTWWAWHQGKENKPGGNYQWVCPMGYDISEWEPSDEIGKYLLYFGRVIDCKGMAVIHEIAKRVEMPVIICGTGDATPWLSEDVPNLTYKPAVTGMARSDLLRNAYAMLMPTIYTEPFGGAGVEGMLCGTPLLASDHGAFSETVIHGVTGYRCKTLGDWLEAVENAGKLPRHGIAEYTRGKYCLENVGKQMDKIFRQIAGLDGNGWYSYETYDAIWG